MQKPLFYSCDIETLGVKVDSPVIEIGITAVTVADHQGTPEFLYTTHSIVLGVADTVMVDSEFRRALIYHYKTAAGYELLAQSLGVVVGLHEFLTKFEALLRQFGSIDRDALWYFRGPQFDQVMIEYNLQPYTHAVPWKYYNVRCQRTVDRMCKKPDQKVEVAHRAGPDSRDQAVRLVTCLKELQGPDPEQWQL